MSELELSPIIPTSAPLETDAEITGDLRVGGALELGAEGDANLQRVAPAVLRTDGSLQVLGSLQAFGIVSLSETSDPIGVAESARLYARDNGSGKTQLCLRFGTGAVVVLATEA